MKFKVGDICVAKDRDWFIPTKFGFKLNSWKIVGTEDNYYILEHLYEYRGEAGFSSWIDYSFEEQFELDIKRYRRIKLGKINEIK